MRGYFVTGTGTGVGKTHVTAALARVARETGQRVFAFKPIETGCTWIDGQLVGADQTLLCEAAGGWQSGLLRGVYQFEPPVAPFVASESIDLDLFDRVLNEGAAHADLTLVEGAGGWRVPITQNVDMAGLAKRCGLPVIVVATATLGTINHSLLTLESVERSGCVIAGLVLSKHPSDDEPSARSNVEQISRRWDGNIVLLENAASLRCFT